MTKSNIPVKPASPQKPKVQSTPSKKSDVGRPTAPAKDVGK